MSLDFIQLESHWSSSCNQPGWNSPFVLPSWLKSWWHVFRGNSKIFLHAGYNGNEISGIAPLKRDGSLVSFMGDIETCDYQDFVTFKGAEPGFFNALLDYFERKDIRNLELKHVRPESATMKYLAPLAKSRGYTVSHRAETVSIEIDLPSSWTDYLNILDKKQRHEVRRKLRRLQETDGYSYYFKPGLDPRELERFLQLFSLSRHRKAGFMTPRMTDFFKMMIEQMSETHSVYFGCLDINKQRVAMIIIFDYNNTVYLYNSAFDPSYSYFSAGLLSKVLGIKESIFLKRVRWDFLKGNEPYKKQLGGKEINLYNIKIHIN